MVLINAVVLGVMERNLLANKKKPIIRNLYG